MEKKIIIADDEKDLVKIMVRALRGKYSPQNIEVYHSGKELQERVSEGRTDDIALVVTDNDFEDDINGKDVALELRTRWPGPIRVQSGKFTGEDLNYLKQRGIDAYYKPFDFSEFEEYVKSKVDVQQ